MHQPNHPPPTLVNDTIGRLHLNVRFHATLTTSQAQSPNRATPYPTSHLYIHAPHHRQQREEAPQQNSGPCLTQKDNKNTTEGTTLLKFICGQLYNGKLAKRYGHALTDECPLCHIPDSCTHIARVCNSTLLLQIEDSHLLSITSDTNGSSITDFFLLRKFESTW